MQGIPIISSSTTILKILNFNEKYKLLTPAILTPKIEAFLLSYLYVSVGHIGGCCSGICTSFTVLWPKSSKAKSLVHF